MRHALTRLLQTAGFGVTAAATGLEAIAQVQKERPDLVLLDVRLPDIDGFEVLRQIKADPILRHTFVVHLTAQRGSPEETEHGLRLGADGYLIQPIEPGELVARLEAFLRHKQAMDDLKASESRYRAIFEQSPQPMWIYEASTLRFIAVNRAAVAHYGYGDAEFNAMRLDEVVIDGERPRQVAPNCVLCYDERHRTHGGRVVDVLVSEHTVQWGRAAGVISLIFDITERKRAERQREQLIQRYRAEMQAVEELSSATHSPSLTETDDAPVAQRLPAVFNAAVTAYATILDAAVEERIYKVNNTVSEKLRTLAGRLVSARATPRDVIEVHFKALLQRAPEPGQPRAQGYIEAGRMTVVELMGYLAGVYRAGVPQVSVATAAPGITTR